jgi:hypothetical protein
VELFDNNARKKTLGLLRVKLLVSPYLQLFALENNKHSIPFQVEFVSVSDEEEHKSIYK